MKKRWVVRVVETRSTSQVLIDLLENLRYAGMVVLHPSGVAGEQLVFDIILPGTHEKGPCEALAARMETFGFNAVAAPDAR